MNKKSLYFDTKIWIKAIGKAQQERRSLAAVLRRLLELWVNDEIDLKL